MIFWSPQLRNIINQCYVPRSQNWYKMFPPEIKQL